MQRAARATRFFPVLTLGPDHMALKCRFEDKEIAKTVPFWKWHGKSKTWRYPIDVRTFYLLKEKFPGIRIAPAVEQAIADKESKVEHARKVKDSTKVAPAEPMPVKVRPYEHQVKGYDIVSTIMGIYGGR